MAFYDNLVLYERPTCPFCMKVLTFMQANDIECELRDVREPGVKDELVAIGGMGQVPCLIIDGKPLYESDDIIAYFKTLL